MKLFLTVIIVFSSALFCVSNAQTANDNPIFPDKVEPLIQNDWTTFTWPYNAYYPNDPDGPNGKVGNACGFNSIARVMHYWQYPVNGIGTINFTDYFGHYWFMNLSEMNLNYPEMQYTFGLNATEEEYDETARLFLAAGAVGEKIGIAYSDGPSKVPAAMVNYFGYKSGAQLVHRWDYTKEEWINIFKNELSNGRPIIVEGRTTDSPAPWQGGNWKGHWWICDGYNENDEFYINYSFGGTKGYYDIDNLGEIYIAYNSAIIGIEPDWGDKELELEAPIAEQTFINNEPITVDWTSTSISNVEVWFSSDNGYNWELVGSSISSASQTYSFNVNNLVSEVCRVKITDVDNVNINRISAVFEVRNPVVSMVKLLSPTGGEYFTNGKSYKIRWESELVNNIAIEISLNNGDSWGTLATSYPATEGYVLWNVNAPNSTACLVRISNSENSEIQSVSSSTFTISSTTLLGGAYANDSNTMMLFHFDDNYWNESPNSEDAIPSSTQTFVDNSTLNLKKAIQFSNPDDKVIINNTDKLSLSGDWTIEMWVNFTEFSSSPMYLISKPGDEDSYQSNFSIQINPYWDNVWFGFYFPSKDVRVGVTATKPDLNKWYHVAFIRNTSRSEIQLIIHDQNRNQISTNAISYSGNLMLQNSQNLELGGNFKGYMDEVRISNVVRSFEVITPPTNPGIPTPSNNATNVDFNSTTLRWFNGTNTKTVDLYLGKNNPPTEKVLDNATVKTSQTVSLLEPNTEYYWQVVCKNTGGDTPGPIWKFTTKSDASVSVVKPNGGEQLRGGSEFEIEWNSKAVESVKIELSTDAGQHWETLSESTPAANMKFTTNLPEVSSETCFIRISDASNNSIVDQNNTAFSLFIPTLKLTYPLTNNEFSAGDKIMILWSCLHVEKINLEFSSDNGDNWENVISGFDADAGSYTWNVPEVVSDNCKFKITSNEDPSLNFVSPGTFKIIESTAIGEHADLPKEYELNQNYPNPFNPTTTIEFALPNSEYVSLKVYDLLGHEVETLVTGFKSAGVYSIQFNASQLSSGMYMYVLKTEHIHFTKNLVLIK